MHRKKREAKTPIIAKTIMAPSFGTSRLHGAHQFDASRIRLIARKKAKYPSDAEVFEEEHPWSSGHVQWIRISISSY
jgi:hypothetical protein